MSPCCLRFALKIAAGQREETAMTAVHMLCKGWKNDENLGFDRISRSTNRRVQETPERKQEEAPEHQERTPE